MFIKIQAYINICDNTNLLELTLAFKSLRLDILFDSFSIDSDILKVYFFGKILYDMISI